MSSYATSTRQISERMLLPSFFLRVLKVTMIVMLGFAVAPQVHADPELAVEKAIVKSLGVYEKEGFDFRADVWIREVTPQVGKAVRIQMFKGNEYRVVFGMSPKSKGVLSGQVLDAQGAPIATKIERTRDGKTIILHVTPKKTGVYMGVVRLEEGATEPVLCGMIAGYK